MTERVGEIRSILRRRRSFQGRARLAGLGGKEADAFPAAFFETAGECARVVCGHDDVSGRNRSRVGRVGYERGAPAAFAFELEDHREIVDGVGCSAAVLYEARAAGGLSGETRDAMEAGTLEGVLLFSPRTAALFAELVTDAGLSETCRDMIVYCLSPAVAEKAQSLAWRDVVVATEPSQEALLRALGT